MARDVRISSLASRLGMNADALAEWFFDHGVPVLDGRSFVPEARALDAESRFGRDPKQELERWLDERGVTRGPHHKDALQTLVDIVPVAERGPGTVDDLKSHITLHCAAEPCRVLANRSLQLGHATVAFATDRRAECDVCGGSDNAQAARAMIDACQRAGRSRLLVVGGAPGTAEALLALTEGSGVDVRIAFDDRTRSTSAAEADVDWAHIRVVWQDTEVSHTLSQRYTEYASRKGLPFVTVRRRGIKALCEAVVLHVWKAR